MLTINIYKNCNCLEMAYKSIENRDINAALKRVKEFICLNSKKWYEKKQMNCNK